MWEAVLRASCNNTDAINRLGYPSWNVQASVAFFVVVAQLMLSVKEAWTKSKQVFAVVLPSGVCVWLALGNQRTGSTLSVWSSSLSINAGIRSQPPVTCFSAWWVHWIFCCRLIKKQNDAAKRGLRYSASTRFLDIDKVKFWNSTKTPCIRRIWYDRNAAVKRHRHNNSVPCSS